MKKSEFFLDEQMRLKRLSNVYNHLVERRNEKARELANLKSKDNDPVSFVNPTYEGPEAEESPLLPLSEEDAEKARELEAEIKEFDDLSLTKMLKLEIHFSVYVDHSLISWKVIIPWGERIRELFRREGVTLTSIVAAIVMTLSAIVEGIVLATRSAVSAVTPKPDPKPDPDPDSDPKPDPDPDPDPDFPKTWNDRIKDQLK